MLAAMRRAFPPRLGRRYRQRSVGRPLYRCSFSSPKRAALRRGFSGPETESIFALGGEGQQSKNSPAAVTTCGLVLRHHCQR